MGREQKRRLDARKAKQLVQSGQAQRRSGVTGVTGVVKYVSEKLVLYPLYPTS